uniref:Uncharacterized protein n=1 Tax=Tetranychus urticae TaxID=32264 RepID=T1KH73_TETUR
MLPMTWVDMWFYTHITLWDTIIIKTIP